MLHMVRELMKRTQDYIVFISFCYIRKLVSPKNLLKLETTIFFVTK